MNGRTRTKVEATDKEISVHHCRGIGEFQECIAIERAVWRSEDIDVVPLPLFVIAAETGGQVLGAFHGSKMVGFTLAIAGWSDRRPFLHSHMTAVLEAYWNRGIARQLKLFQREDAVARGISRVEWTFDPFLRKNARFNLMKLGAIVRRYLPNFYGITTSPLHAALPTDRLLAEWHLRSPRVRRALAGKEPVAAHTSKAVRISVPAALENLRGADPAQAARLQAQIREEFMRRLAKGYVVTAVEYGSAGEPNSSASDAAAMNYILEPAGSLKRHSSGMRA